MQGLCKETFGQMRIPVLTPFLRTRIHVYSVVLSVRSQMHRRSFIKYNDLDDTMRNFDEGVWLGGNNIGKSLPYVIDEADKSGTIIYNRLKRN